MIISTLFLSCHSLKDFSRKFLLIFLIFYLFIAKVLGKDIFVTLIGFIFSGLYLYNISINRVFVNLLLSNEFYKLLVLDIFFSIYEHFLQVTK